MSQFDDTLAKSLIDHWDDTGTLVPGILHINADGSLSFGENTAVKGVSWTGIKPATVAGAGTSADTFYSVVAPDGGDSTGAAGGKGGSLAWGTGNGGASFSGGADGGDATLNLGAGTGTGRGGQFRVNASSSPGHLGFDYGVDINISTTSAVSETTNHSRGVHSQNTFTGANNIGTLSGFYGTAVHNSPTATVVHLIGTLGGFTFSNTGTASIAAGIYVDNQIHGAGTISAGYGVWQPGLVIDAAVTMPLYAAFSFGNPVITAAMTCTNMFGYQGGALSAQSGTIANLYDAQFPMVSGATNNNVGLLIGALPTGPVNAHLYINGVVQTSGAPTLMSVIGPAHTGLTVAEQIDVRFALSRTVTLAAGGGTIGTQRTFVIDPVTYASVSGALTYTTAGTLVISGAPVAGTNVTISNSYALWVQSGKIFVAGNIVGGAGVNITGASCNLNNSSNFGTNIGTGTSTGLTTIGNALGTLTIAVPTTVHAATVTNTGAVTDGYLAGTRATPTYDGAFTVARHNYLDLNNPLLTNSAVVTDAAVMRFDAAAGTHKALDAGTTKTTPGTVNAWVKVNVNGTINFVPAYTSKTA